MSQIFDVKELEEEIVDYLGMYDTYGDNSKGSIKGYVDMCLTSVLSLLKRHEDKIKELEKEIEHLKNKQI